MGNQDLAQVKDLFDEVFEMDPQERERYLQERTEKDGDAVSLLAALYSSAPALSDFLERPALCEVDALFREVESESPPRFQIDRYMVERELGRGGMGVVYLASRADDAFEKKVALKLVWPGLSQAEKRFRQERQILANLDHPNIARLMDGGTTSEGWQFLVMEYVDGILLTTYCRNHNLSIQQRLQLFLQICDAVEHAHRNKILHRDIKPGNILVTEAGQVKLLDFGIAKIADTSQPNREMTVTGVRLLTPEYASPEQILGNPITEASDIYSLGLVAFELLTGALPLTPAQQKRPMPLVRLSDDLPLMSASLRYQDTDSPGFPLNRDSLKKSLSGDLDAIVAKALKREPADRYLTASELAADVRAYLDGRPLASEFPGWPQRSYKWVLRNRRLSALLSLLVLSIGLAGFWTIKKEIERRHENRISEYRQYSALLHQAIQDWGSNEFAKVAEEMSTIESKYPGLENLEFSVLSHLTNRSEVTVELPFLPERIDQFSNFGREVVSSVDGQKLFLRSSDLMPLSHFTPGQGENILLGDFGNISLLKRHRKIVPFELDTLKEYPSFDLVTEELRSFAIVDTPGLKPLLVWLDGENVVRLNSYLDGRELRQIHLDGKPATWIFADDSSQFAAIINEQRVEIHKLAQELPPQKFESKMLLTTGWFLGPDRMLFGAQGSLYVYDPHRGESLRKLELPSGASGTTAVGAPPGLIVAALNDGDLVLWDPVSLQWKMIVPKVAEKAYRIHISRDLTLATISRTDGVANIVDLRNGKLLTSLKGHSRKLNLATITLDNHHILTSSEDKTVRRWNLDDVLRPTEIVASSPKLYCLDMKPDGSLIAAGGIDGKITLAKPDSGETVTLQAHRGIVYNLLFSKDGTRMLSCAEDGITQLWDTGTWKPLRTYQTGIPSYRGQIRVAEFLADGRRVALGGNDGVVRIWDSITGVEERSISTNTKVILSLKLSPDGKQLASGSEDGVLKLWNTETWEEQASLSAHNGRIWTVAYSPDGREIATGSGDQLIKIWRVSDLAPVTSLSGHSMGIFKLAWYPDGKGLITVSDDKSIRFWHRDSGVELLALKSHTDEVWGLAISKDGSKIVTGGFDGTLRIWRTSQSRKIAVTPPAFKLNSTR